MIDLIVMRGWMVGRRRGRRERRERREGIIVTGWSD